jgi:hypothetical protein
LRPDPAFGVLDRGELDQDGEPRAVLPEVPTLEIVMALLDGALPMAGERLAQLGWE